MAKLPTESMRDASIKSMRTRFLVPYEPQIEQQLNLAPPFEEIALAFRQNITSVLSVVTLPFALASSAVHRQHYHRISTAEAIRAGVVVKPRPEMSAAERASLDAALQKSAERMRELVQSPEGQLQIGSDISSFLLTSMEEDALASSTVELLLQGVASVWTAFEVLSRDLFIAHLNLRPELVVRLVEHPSTKKRFEAAKVPLVDLINSGFNLSNGMGDYLSRQQDLSDFISIKTTFGALRDGPSVFSDANSLAMILLNARRHLIVHRRGVIDGRYLTATGASGQIGARLMISPDDFEEHLEACVEAGNSLLSLFTER